MRKFVLSQSNGAQQTVRCENKREANKIAKQAEKLLGVVVVSVTEVK